jgi:hypothetical protein
MAGFDLASVATGGATRPDSFSGMTPEFAAALQTMFGAAPPNVRSALQVSSGYRSPDRQAQLYADAIKKYGNADAARKWVAPPGKSKHNHGQAADLKFLNDVAKQWVHQNAANYGLSFPLANENWHVEMAGARGGHQPAPSTSSLTSNAPTSTSTFTAAEAPSTSTFTSGASPTSFGDLVAPAPAAASDLGHIAAQFMASRQQRADTEAADRARKQALFGGGLGDLYA